MDKKLQDLSLEELWELFPIILKEHNKAYGMWYLEEVRRIQAVIGQNKIFRINHIGSSAVKGLLAKPTIDILLEVKREVPIAKSKESLCQNGWICMQDQKKPERKIVLNKGYTPQGFSERVYHLHLRYPNDWDELYFRDYLLVNPIVAEAYGRLKQSLLPEYKNNRDGYTQAKGEFIKKYTVLAKTEFASRYLP